MRNSLVLYRTEDQNVEGILFQTEGGGLEVRIPTFIVEQFDLPDRGDGSGFTYGGLPVEMQALELCRHIEIPRDPVADFREHMQQELRRR